jgi:hypothetical protein
MIDGIPRPDHGTGYQERVCTECDASWVGLADDGCGWCERALERQRADQRLLLLDPPHLRTSVGDPRYDQLCEDSKLVWDVTRGQRRGTDSVLAWTQRLARAVEAELITRREAEQAMRRTSR